MKRTFLFATIASILSINAFADPATITTQDYVDTNFQTKIPAQSANWPKELITTTNTAGVVGTAGIYDTTYTFYDDTLDYYSNAGQYLATMHTLNTALQYITDGSRASALSENAEKRIPVFSASNSDKFNAMITTNTLDYQGIVGTGNVIPTLTAVSTGMATKQDKMTCAQYLENAAQTSENCLLWNVPD